MKDQFFNYVIEKYNRQNNKPVYGKVNEQIGDHRLDALMLALGALVLEESVYSGNKMFASIPSFHKMKEIETRLKDNSSDIIESASKASFPGALQLLEIHRQERSFSSRNKENNISILEGINKYKGTSKGMTSISELRHSKRRGFFNKPSKRSWK